MADVREREKIAREIEKMSESIRKKYCVLKTGRIEEGIALNRHFKSLIESRRAHDKENRATKMQCLSLNVRERRKRNKRKKKKRTRRSDSRFVELHLEFVQFDGDKIFHKDATAVEI